LETIKHKTINEKPKEQEHRQPLQYFYRKLQSVAKGISLSVTLPKQYVVDLNLRPEDFVRMSVENGKIVMEKAM